MIEAYGKALVVRKCKEGAGGKVNLASKMIREGHVAALAGAVEEHKVEELYLEYNQLGAGGAAALGKALATGMPTLKTLGYVAPRPTPSSAAAHARTRRSSLAASAATSSPTAARTCRA